MPSLYISIPIKLIVHGVIRWCCLYSIVDGTKFELTSNDRSPPNPRRLMVWFCLDIFGLDSAVPLLAPKVVVKQKKHLAVRGLVSGRELF